MTTRLIYNDIEYSIQAIYFHYEGLGVAKVFPCTDIISLDYPDQIDIHNTLSGS